MTYRTYATWSAFCGAIGTGAWLLLGYGLVASPLAQEALGPPLLEPQMVLANNGVASLTLEAAPSVITVHDRTFTSNVYNGQYTPPVFRCGAATNFNYGWSTGLVRPTCAAARF